MLVISFVKWVSEISGSPELDFVVGMASDRSDLGLLASGVCFSPPVGLNSGAVGRSSVCYGGVMAVRAQNSRA